MVYVCKINVNQRYFFLKQIFSDKGFIMFINVAIEAMNFTKNNFLRLFLLSLHISILVYLYLLLSEFILERIEYNPFYIADIVRINFINILIISFLYTPIIVSNIRGVSINEKTKINYIEYLFSNSSVQTYLILATLIILFSSLFSLIFLIWPSLLKIPTSWGGLILYLIFAAFFLSKFFCMLSKLSIYLASKVCDKSIYFENMWKLIDKQQIKSLAFTIFALLIILVMNAVFTPFEKLIDNFTSLNKYLVLSIKIVMTAFGITIMGTFWGIVGGVHKEFISTIDN